MYCPKCGQLQPDDVRFCSRCGLLVSEITQWLAGAFVLTNPEPTKKQISPRRKAILQTAKVTFFSGVAVPIGFLLAMAARNGVFLIIPLIVFTFSLVWMLYCRLFLEGSISLASQTPQPFRIPTENYVPPLHGNPASAPDPRRVNTAEMVKPPSITEYTTHLLGKKDEPNQ